MGWFGWQMAGQPKILSYIQYWLRDDLAHNFIHTIFIKIVGKNAFIIMYINCLSNVIKTVILFFLSFAWSIRWLLIFDSPRLEEPTYSKILGFSWTSWPLSSSVLSSIVHLWLSRGYRCNSNSQEKILLNDLDITKNLKKNSYLFSNLCSNMER